MSLEFSFLLLYLMFALFLNIYLLCIWQTIPSSADTCLIVARRVRFRTILFKRPCSIWLNDQSHKYIYNQNVYENSNSGNSLALISIYYFLWYMQINQQVSKQGPTFLQFVPTKNYFKMFKTCAGNLFWVSFKIFIL
jgi:hypothetical protein